MKKVTLILAALALVLGLSQCKKQEEPVANGQKQHIVLTADNGNDGSKVSADFVSANLNLTWDGDEVITVSGGATGTLDKITVDQSNPSKATFEGDIEITDESTPFVFTVGETPNYEDQLGTEIDCEAWIHDNISLTGTDYYDPEGQYSADMELPYAVLKLDVSALGTSGKLEIKAGGTLAASVANVSNPTAVFVAVPTDGSEMEYKISIGDKTATKTWTLLPNTFYTKSNETGGGTGYAFVIEPDAPAVEYPGLCFTAVDAGATVKLEDPFEVYSTLELQYSSNGSNWDVYTLGNIITLSNVGDKVYFRRKEKAHTFSTPMTTESYMNFVTDNTDDIKKIAASGNIMSLLDPKCEVTEFDSQNGSGCFYMLFAGCTSLTTAPELPATTLADSCYYSMFAGCTSLTTAPELPATALAEYCYSSMFAGCTSLTTAPALPATTLTIGCYEYMFGECSLTTAPELKATTLAEYCYSFMFCDCTSLTTAPELPATDLAEYCYSGMFYGCSFTTAPALPATTLAGYCYSQMFQECKLTTAPALPATTLAEYCYYQMFEDCTSLTAAPALPVTTLAEGCYQIMFRYCTSLKAAPELPATALTTNCYGSMFYGCTSLTTAPELPATDLAERCYQSMFGECTLTTAPELKATDLAEYCYDGMFYGCTSLTTAPELPATTLAEGCYSGMFEDCTSLTTAPALPATTLAIDCYYAMFSGCCDLNSITVHFTNWNPSMPTNRWVKEVSSTGTFRCPSGLPETHGESFIPNGWTKVNL